MAMLHKFLMQMRLKELRKQRGLTQEQVATALGVEQPSVSRLEAGKQNASLETLEALATLYGVGVPDLFVYDGPNELMRLAQSLDPELVPVARDVLLTFLRHRSDLP
jgi:transcriptional regulator with XRE-family HTH domain